MHYVIYYVALTLQVCMSMLKIPTKLCIIVCMVLCSGLETLPRFIDCFFLLDCSFTSASRPVFLGYTLDSLRP